MSSRARYALVSALALTILTGAPAAAAPPPAPLDYTALGDSYSAGAFVRPWAVDDGCGRSTLSYPQQAARRLNVRLTDVTCSAAEVRAGVLEQQTEFTGPPSVPPKAGWAPRPAQIKAVTAATDLVTLGIGGNSVGFVDIVTKCIEQGIASFGTGSPCSAHYSRGSGKSRLDAGFTALEADFATTLKGIRTRAPHAKVAVIGYPAVVADAKGCSFGSWRQLGTVTKGDMPFLDALERRVNTVLRTQAQRAGAAYVDTYTSSTGHGVCSAPDQRWIYGIKDDLTGSGTQSDPPSGLCRRVPATGEACTFLHPNLPGTTHQAALVTQALTELGAIRR
ncbi:SGNH/GDSL hydrolase family protein [Streptomyces sp. NBC_01343]|uniref:SGNH/GDSL hydrolase family protein n=1 Tax=Streptomyces sp. NBC_01343 TaxID=2903832 RepID=UPI002E106C16|nr:SGNH/GDSL hydrolase family protein [Streptomyces sp. NBC_01343]